MTLNKSSQINSSEMNNPPVVTLSYFSSSLEFIQASIVFPSMYLLLGLYTMVIGRQRKEKAVDLGFSLAEIPKV